MQKRGKKQNQIKINKIEHSKTSLLRRLKIAADRFDFHLVTALERRFDYPDIIHSQFQVALGKKRAGKKGAGNNSAIKRVLGEMSAR